MKRNLAHLHQTDNTSLADHDGSTAKKRCLSLSTKPVDYSKFYNNHNINPSSDDDSESSMDENDEGDVDSNPSIKRRSIKALQRSLRFVAPIDSKLSKAVSQYSDNDEDDDENLKCNEDMNTSFFSNKKHRDTYESSEENNNNDYHINTSRNSHHFDNIRRKSQSTSDILSFNYSNNFNNRNSLNALDMIHLKEKNNIDSFGTFNLSTKMVKQNSLSIPQSDFVARSRCFDYLVTAIDEAWARYCDSTSYDEDVAYELNEPTQTANTPISNAYTSDEDDGYKSEFSATTSVTEYDSDYHNKPQQSKNRSFGIMNTNNYPIQHNRRVSEVPENLRLQELKDRFTKSKYFLEDLVDSDSYNDCISFWNKWDLIKYSIVDFVEEDEDDEEVEKKIDELESGRFVGSLSSN